MKKLPKLNIKDGWYPIANLEFPLPYLPDSLQNLYYWIVYVENGYPIGAFGDKFKDRVENHLSVRGNTSIATSRKNMMLTCEKTWGKTAYQYLIEYGHPIQLTPVLQNGDDIYQLDFS